MESSGPQPADQEVPLADAAIAARIAHAAASGRAADRQPTLEQLLAAFGEREPTEQARRRVAAALRVAGVGVRPDLMQAPPGQRVQLLPTGVGGAGWRPGVIGGAAALVAVLVVAAIAAALVGGGDDGSVAESLPETVATTAAPTTGTTPAPAPTTTPLPETTTTAETTDTVATTETTDTTPTTPTTSTTTPEEEPEDEGERRERDKERESTSRPRRPVSQRPMTVRVDATGSPTYLCVVTGGGRLLYAGMLDGKEVFRARRLRMNIGLSTTRVTVNGKRVPLTSSPIGLDISRKDGIKTLGLGQLPCG